MEWRNIYTALTMALVFILVMLLAINMTYGLDIIEIGNEGRVDGIDAYQVELVWLSCTESWSCTSWSSCVALVQTRTCIDIYGCGTNTTKPVEAQACSTTTGGGSPATVEEVEEAVKGLEVDFSAGARKTLLILSLFVIVTILFGIFATRIKKRKLPLPLRKIVK